MKTKRKETQGKNVKDSKFYTSFPFIIFVIIAVFLTLFFLWHQKNWKETTEQQDTFPKSLTEDIAVPEQVGSPKPSSEFSRDSASVDGQTDEETSIAGQQVQTESLEGDGTSESSGPGQQYIELSEKQPSTGLSSAQQGKAFIDKKCEKTAKFIEEFFRHLDQQQYLEKYEIKPNSQVYFFSLLQNLLDHPPVVSGETDDLYTILQNTAHFFRIIGNTNIAMLKIILSNEKEQFENVAANFYSLVTSPSCAEHFFDVKINKPSLYEYAGFFLNTMGGRLYLFRRDSISRMVISYYSILLIDKANIESFNKHGVEISTSIDLLISEMESTTNTLKLKETYLSTLYALQEQYQ